MTNTAFPKPEATTVRGRGRPMQKQSPSLRTKLRLEWAIPRFSVPLGASLVLRAKPLHYMRQAVIAGAAGMVIFLGTAPFDQTVEYARSRVRWAR